MQRKHLFMSGRVQGVYFRVHTRDKAVSLGIRGWVRNLPDGRVEAVVEGDDLSVEKMVEWCRTGTPPARVHHVDVIEEGPGGDFEGFSILPTPARVP